MIYTALQQRVGEEDRCEEDDTADITATAEWSSRDYTALINSISVIIQLYVPLVPVSLHAPHYFLCINSCGRYQFQNLFAEAVLVLNIASHGSNKHILLRQTRIHESHIPSFYYLNELARSNAAHLDKFRRE
jgi:hypothetical protein